MYVVALALSLLGCGDEVTTSAKMPQIDPCTLITYDEAASVLKTSSVGQGLRQNSGTFDQCQYLGEGQKLADSAALTVQVHRADFESIRQAYRQNGEQIVDVPEMANAFWDTRNNFLFAQHDAITLGIQVAKNAPDNRENALRMMRLAATRVR